MIDYGYAAFFGLIQGITEFAPVSSSGHLVIFHEILNFDFKDALSFDVILHAGTLLALIIFFYKDIISYLKAFFKSFKNFDLKNDINQQLAWFILIASIPAAFFGYLLEDQAESIFRSPFLVAVMLVLGGVLFIIFEKIFRQFKELKEMRSKSALVIGFFQILSIVPGVSRSGITMAAGLSQGLKREEAARLSFLLAIPLIFGAVVKRISVLFSSSLGTNEIVMLAVGFLFSFISGYFVIKYLLRFLKTHSLNVFAYYRFILALAVIIYFWVCK